MSGIVGIYEQDGAPIDRPLLQALTRFLDFRGPDNRDTWSNGPVALGHALLATTREAHHERQPANLEGRFWITADARIDCRAELIEKMKHAGRLSRAGVTDAELILEAWAVWGEACVQHLRGDFAFALWDAPRKLLFCARDHFGVKPFYYAHLGDTFVFSNTLDCVRLHPAISETLNDTAVTDFLLFGLNCDVATTYFRDVQRLPPAHTLTVTPDAVRLERYWSAPTKGRIRYENPHDYAEHFRILLQEAVSDRLRTDSVGLLMSGGLDSGTVAATARDLSRAAGNVPKLHALTMIYESLIPDQEGAYAKESAQFLGIPIQCLKLDRLRPFEGWAMEDDASDDDGNFQWPEPVDDPFFAGLFIQFRAIAANCRVALSGDGGDNLMHFQMWPHAKDMVRNREWFTLAQQVPRYLRARHSPVAGIHRRVRKVFGDDPLAAIFPTWLSPDLVARLNLRDRLSQWSGLPDDRPHPVLPKGHASLSLPQWPHSFELQDGGVTRCPVEMRHPFLDLRVVNYLLSLPPFPHYLEKKLLREVLAGRVPESVRLRKKSPLAGDPLQHYIRKPDTKWIRGLRWAKEMQRYVDTSILEPLIVAETEELAQAGDSNRTNSTMRPVCLNFWLQSMRRVRYNLLAEARNG